MAKKGKKLESQNEAVVSENEATKPETSNNNEPANVQEGANKVEPIKLKVTQTVTALDTMEDVRLMKIVSFENPSTIEEATARLGNDTSKLLAIIIRGMQADVKDAAKSDPDNWYTIDGKGNPETLFAGECVDPDKVGGLIREMARIGGYTDAKGNTEKRQEIRKKATAMVKAMIQSNEELKKSVALSAESDVVKEEETEESA